MTVPYQWRADIDGVVDGSSAAKISAFGTYALNTGCYMQAAVAWADGGAATPYDVPVTAETTTPLAAVPIPLGTKPGNTNDKSLAIRSAAGVDFDMAGAHYNTTTTKIDHTSYGAFCLAGAAYETGPGSNSGTASCIPLRPTTIFPSEINAGVISHALACSFPNVGPAPNPYPARPGSSGYPGNTGIPLGTWLRVDPAVNVAALGMSIGETTIAVALQTYGMFVRDINPSDFSIYLSDEVNQAAAGNSTNWNLGSKGITLPILNAGYPYAQQFSATFVTLLRNHLQVLLPPSTAATPAAAGVYGSAILDTFTAADGAMPGTWTKDTAIAAGDFRIVSNQAGPSAADAVTYWNPTDFGGVGSGEESFFQVNASGAQGKLWGPLFEYDPVGKNGYVCCANPAGSVWTNFAMRLAKITNGLPAGISHAAATVGNFGVGLTTLAVSPVTIGDAVTVCVKIPTGHSVATMSGGGVTTWTKQDALDDGVRDVEIWTGIVTATGAATLTITYNGGTPGAGNTELTYDQWTVGRGAASQWTFGPANHVTTASSTACPLPTLAVPAVPGVYGYIGTSYFANTYNGGLTAGYTKITTGTNNAVIYNTSVPAGSSQAPTHNQTAGGNSTTVGVIIGVSVVQVGVDITGLNLTAGDFFEVARQPGSNTVELWQWTNGAWVSKGTWTDGTWKDNAAKRAGMYGNDSAQRFDLFGAGILTLPANVSPPVVTGLTDLGALLTGTNGTWSASPAAAFTYQWQRLVGGVWVDIATETAPTHSIVALDQGASVRLRVTGTNQFGAATVSSNEVAVPAAGSSPPIISPPTPGTTGAVTLTPMTFKEIVDAVLADAFPPSKRDSAKRWVIARHTWLWDYAEWVFRFATAPVVFTAGIETVAVPDDFQIAIELWDANGVPYAPVRDARRFVQGSNALSADGPSTFTVIDGQLLTGSLGDGSTGTLLYEKRKPILSADGDLTGLPDGYELALVHGAKAEGFKLTNIPLAADFEAEFAAAVTAMQRNYLTGVRGQVGQFGAFRPGRRTLAQWR